MSGLSDHIINVTRWNCGMFARDPGQYERERVDGDPQFEAKSWNYSNRKESTLLVLQRKISESIRIGEDVVITVVRIGPGDVVRLGISAPREMNIVRTEIDDGRQKEPPCTPS